MVNKEKNRGILGNNIVVQVAFLVRDIETVKKNYADFLGIDVPPTYDSGDYAVTQTLFDGKAAPEAGALLAYLPAGEQTQIELIQPNGKPSIWQECLDKNGEGFHHIAFSVNDSNEALKKCETFGMQLRQTGK